MSNVAKKINNLEFNKDDEEVFELKIEEEESLGDISEINNEKAEEDTYDDEDGRNKKEVEEESSEQMINSYLNILTWEEICNICSNVDTTSPVLITELVKKEMQDIFGKKKKIDDENDEKVVKKDGHEKVKVGPKDVEHSYDEEDTNEVQVDSKGRIKIYDHGAEKRKKEEEKRKKVNVGEFILKQKEKFREQQRELKKGEIYELYKDNANVEINTSCDKDKLDENAFVVNSNKGILINKRQK